MISFRSLFVIFSTAQLIWTHYVQSRQLSRNRNQTVPPELKGIITKESFLKAQAYNLDKRVTWFVCDILRFVFELLTILYVSPRIFNYCCSVFPGSESKATVAWTLLSSLWGMLITLPMGAYGDFVIEQRHGFNKKTVSLFLTDALKGFAIEAVLTTLFTPCLIYVANSAGPNLHWYVWGFAQVLTVIMTFIYPTFIQPLFNKFEALKDEKLRRKIEELASAHQFPLTQLFQVDGSKRSSHSNAYFYGFWKNKRIVLFDTLLTLSHPEILAILCHEIGHWWHSHMLWNLGLVSGYLFLLLKLYGLFVADYGEKLCKDFGFELVNGKVGFIIGLMLFKGIYTPIDQAFSLFQTSVSRRFEFQADRFAVDAGRGKDLGAALKKLQTENLSEMDPDWLYSTVHYSHPPLLERLRAIDSPSEVKAMVDKKEL